MKDSPKISVILPVYNAERFLRESIDSIMNQTFTDFELILLNDGSTDSSQKIMESYSDPRIRLYSHANMGLAATLNRGIELAKAPLIARQDNDDISLPQRLEKQFSFMEENPDVALLGSAAEIIDDEGKSTGRFHNHASKNTELKFFLLFDNPFVHSSVVFRKAAVTQAGKYLVSADIFEDYNLWSRIARNHRIANLAERLLKYREVQSGMSKTTEDYRLRVKNQRLLNLQFYCKDIPVERLKKFVEYGFSLDGVENLSSAYSYYKKTLFEIARCFCKKEGLRFYEIKVEVDRQLLVFKRSYYSAILHSDKQRNLSKLKARVLRRWIFLVNKTDQ